ncbi:winged helix-turn-helix transcriptional regulator [Streptomyces sp. NPDC001744]|uniref:winged helix-turn-helix transcriptional regulator n=1 Tax=Streptomyces sp. NPDC001744 TaxID=3364606 RepID=UPI0036764165
MDADCRARFAFGLLSSTWNSVVLWVLRDGPGRPGALRGAIGGISSEVLTETLRRPQFNGLVDRRVHPGSPPHVEYELTSLGRALPGPIDAFGAWAFAHGDEVMAVRAAARRAAGPDAPDSDG